MLLQGSMQKRQKSMTMPRKKAVRPVYIEAQQLTDTTSGRHRLCNCQQKLSLRLLQRCGACRTRGLGLGKANHLGAPSGNGGDRRSGKINGVPLATPPTKLWLGNKSANHV